jgi:hypothetical protein
MAKNSSHVWQTKYGSRKVRVDLPTVSEAVFAAQGLTDDPEEQIEIATGLYGGAVEDVRAEMDRLKKSRQVRIKPRGGSIEVRETTARNFVVERRAPRRFVMQ